jgi:hypothetical protein
MDVTTYLMDAMIRHPRRSHNTDLTYNKTVLRRNKNQAHRVLEVKSIKLKKKSVLTNFNKIQQYFGNHFNQVLK